MATSSSASPSRSVERKRHKHKQHREEKRRHHKERDEGKKRHHHHHHHKERKEEKKRHHHKHHHKHRNEKDSDDGEENEERFGRRTAAAADAPTMAHAPSAAAAASAARTAFASVVASRPQSRAELRSLLQLLDSGSCVVVESIQDPTTRSLVQSALQAMGLPTFTLSDGSVAHAKADDDDTNASLAATFADLLEGEADVTPSAPVGAAPHPSTEPHAAPGVAKGAIGPSIGPSVGPSVGPSIGPAAPTTKDDHSSDVEGGGGGGSDDNAPVIGPLPPSRTIAAAAYGEASAHGTRWWEREDAVPKAAVSDQSSAAGAPLERDGWMTALPSDRTDRNATGQAREFRRNGLAELGDLSGWTDTPADRARKAQGAGAGGGQPGGEQQPMSLADAVAIAKANAASGKRPRPPPSLQQQGVADGADAPPAPKSLVDIHGELQEQAKKQRKGKADWEGHHPWRPFDRDTDLDIRQVKPKAKESILNNNVMGSLSERFGGRGQRESSFM